MRLGPSTALFDRVEHRAVQRWGGPRTAVGLVICAMLIWPVIEALGGRVLAAVPPLELIWLRYAVHLTIMLLLGASGSRLSLFRTQFVGLHLGRSLLMLGMPVFWLMAATKLPSSSVMTIFWSSGLLALIGARVLLDERPAAVDILLTIVGLAGAVLVLTPAVPGLTRGTAYALLMSGCYALYLVGTRWLRRDPTAVNLFYSALGVFLALLPVLPFIWRRPPVSTWPPIVMIGLLGLILLFLLDRALHHAAVSRIAPLGVVQPAAEIFVLGAGSVASMPHAARAGLLIILCVVAAAVLRVERGATQPLHRPA